MEASIGRMLRSGIIRASTNAPLGRLFGSFTRDLVAVFTLHRMQDPANNIHGHSPEFLRSTLQYLRREGYNLVSLEDMHKRLRGEGPALHRAVAFTMDDGFADQATVAAPIFMEFDCPVTIFLITGFIDRKLWPWDGRVGHIFLTSRRPKLCLSVGDTRLEYELSSPNQRMQCARDFRQRLKLLSEEAMLDALERLARSAEVEVSQVPVAPYLPMTWDMARQLERKGVTFGPHTVSHGILSRMTRERACYEITQSWRRLTEELAHPIPFLAYPTGRQIDYGIREMRLLEESGLAGAMTTEPGRADLTQWKRSRCARFELNRYMLTSKLEDVMQYSSWIEGAKLLLRMERLRRYSIDNFGGPRHLLKHYFASLWNKLGGFRAFRNVDWTRVQRLVFVCRGNICRSPYAEVRACNAGLNAVSFGLTAKTGAPANPDAIENAAVCGIDLGHHRSRRREDIEIRPGDLLIGMESWQATALQLMAKKQNAQVTLLGLWSTPPRPYIHDPFGHRESYFQACFSVIEAAVDGMVKHVARGSQTPSDTAHTTIA
jgi:protein-tyrosine-phosphatase/peptidoglycan/xylan/chitin deacetylase (PgdA/CDA1 family)